MPQPALSGQAVNVTWTVTNHGIGLTSMPNGKTTWPWPATRPAPTSSRTTEIFDHLGPLAPWGSYTRNVPVTLPNGLSGTYYFVVTAAAEQRAFEFIYGNGTDNVTVSSPFTINLTPPPDLDRHHCSSAPTTAEEGSTIEVGWTVQNVGPGDANGTWQDEVVLQQVGQPDTRTWCWALSTISAALASGKSYSRTEAVQLPAHISGLYNVEVIANYRRQLVREWGDRQQHRHRQSSRLTVTVMPRPDLQVSASTFPAQ